MKKFFIAMVCIGLVTQSTLLDAGTVTIQEDKSIGIEINDTYGELLYEMGLVQGDPVKGLNEESNITRMEIAALIARVSLIHNNDFIYFNAPTTPTFSDVAKTSWYYKYVEYLAATGITLGDGEGHFMPTANVTIEQTLMFLARAWPDYESYETTRNNAENGFREFNIEFTYQFIDMDYKAAAKRKDVFAFIVAALLNENAQGQTLWEAKGLASASMPTISSFRAVAKSTVYEAMTVNMFKLNPDFDYSMGIEKVELIKKDLATATKISKPKDTILEINDLLGPESEAYGVDPLLNQEYSVSWFDQGQDSPLNVVMVAGTIGDEKIPIELSFEGQYECFRTSNGTEIYIISDIRPKSDAEDAMYIATYKTSQGEVGLFAQAGGLNFTKNLGSYR